MISVRISTIPQFRDYMFRKLGEEFYDVELSELQFTDILRDSINTYSHYIESGTYRSQVLIDLDRKRSLILPAEVINVHKILGTSKTPIETAFKQAIALTGSDDGRDDFKYDLLKDGSISVAPTYEDIIADGSITAGDGSNNINPPIIKMPDINNSNSSIYHPLGKDIGYSGHLFYPMFMANPGDMDINLSTYAISMGMFNNIRSLFNNPVYFRYTPESRRLVLGESFEVILVEADILEHPTNFINDDFFKMIVEEKMLTQWADNLSLKYESEGLMGNGINLNTDRMLEKAATLREKIENGFENDEWGGLLPPMRVD